MALLSEREGALRADLQHHYGIDLDHAMAGEHTAMHIAALVDNLPPDARVFAVADPDAEWTLASVIAADIRNILIGYIWSMADPKKRGPEPKRLGPSWMTSDRARKLDARVMTVGELMAELSKPRR